MHAMVRAEPKGERCETGDIDRHDRAYELGYHAEARRYRKCRTMITIIYDGDCPLCDDYAKRLRLVATVGELQLIDARTDTQTTKAYWAKGYDLDEGMIVVIGGDVHHGAAAVTALARLSSSSTIFNTLNHWILSHGPLTRFIYPFMKGFRRIALFALGKKKLVPPVIPTDRPDK